MKIKLFIIFLSSHMSATLAQQGDQKILDSFYKTESFDSIFYYYDQLADKDPILRDFEAIRRYEKACYHKGMTYPALKFLEKASRHLNGFSMEEQFWYFTRAGMYAWETEFLDQSMFYYNKAYPIGRELFGERSEDIAKLLLDIGTIYYYQGNYEDAINSFTKSKETYGDVLGRSSHRYYYLTSLITQAQFKSNPNDKLFGKLIQDIRFALNAAEKYEDEVRKTFWTNRHLTSLVGNFLDQKMPDSAEFYLWQITKNPKGELRIHWAEILRLKGKNSEALQEMKSAIEDFSAWGFDKSRRMADNFALLADIYSSMGNYDNAQYHYDSAIVLLTGERTVESLDINAVNCHNLWPDESLYSILKKKIALSGSNKYGNLEKTLSEQLDYYNFLVNYVNSCLSRFISQSSKLHWASRTDDTYAQAIDTALRLYEITGEKSFFTEALSLANKRKYRLVTENLRKMNITDQLMIPDSLRLKEISTYGEIDKSVRSGDNEKLGENEQHLLQVQDSYKKNFSQIWRLKSDLLHDGNYQFFKEIDEKTAIIQFVSIENKILILYYSTQISMVHSLDAEHGRQLVNSYLTFLRKKEPGWEQKSGNIYQYFLEPVLDKSDSIKKLIIVPDGILSHLPFESLLVSQKEKRFLIEDYEIEYSLNILWNTDMDKSNLQTISAFAPKLELEHNIKEVLEIGNLTNGRIWVGEEATIERFEEESRGSDIIHLATHFKYNADNYLDSYLDFGLANAESAKLRMADILLFQVNADLVVLSACETGLGKIIAGEGVMSVGRSFAYSGVPNLIMSLWKVSGQSTKDIMSSFYFFLKEGLSYNESLREAKLEYLNNADNITSHPYYWSSFVFIGNAGNRKMKSDSSEFFVLIGIIVFAGIIFIANRLYTSYKTRLQP